MATNHDPTTVADRLATGGGDSPDPAVMLAAGDRYVESVTDVCQLRNNLVPIRAEQRFWPLYASRL